MTEKKRPGRPRGAASERLSGGQRGARVTLTIDGESVRKRVRLETTDPAVAKVKLERLQSERHGSAPAPSADTFAEVARVVFDERAARGVARVDIERRRVELHVLPFVGEIASEPFGERVAARITAKEIVEVLAHKRDEGYSLEQVKKMRTAIGYVMARAESPVMGAVKMPPFQAVLKKHRTVASDEVLLAYLAWEHPVERHRAGVRMRQAMSAVSRCIGGQRTNDLHVATWQDNFLIPEAPAEPDFAEVWVPRTKGQAPQLMVTPEGVRPMLRLWWEWSGRPRSGPVFPLLRGERVGAARDEVQDSHADAFRRDLKRALGLEVWDPDAGRGQAGPIGRWVPGRAPTPKEKALFEPGRYTLPVDFHSWRRAWAQALERAGVNVQTSAALTGHASDLRAHGRYLQSQTEAREVPAGAVPDIGRALAKTTGSNMGNREVSSMISGAPERARTSDPWLRRPSQDQVLPGFSCDDVDSGQSENHDESPRDTSAGQYSRPILSALDHIRAACTLSIEIGDWQLVDRLRPILEEFSGAPRPVTDLSVVRAKRGDK